MATRLGLRAFLLAACLAPAGAAAEATLQFRTASGEHRVGLGALEAACPAREVAVEDPYYGERRRYRALPLRCVLALGFGGLPDDFAEAELLLQARDGYVRPAPGAQLLEPGAWLAVADAARLARGEAGFDPIDRRQVDPGPFYLVWSGPHQSDPHRHPWPYQLASIELVRFEARFPHTLPRGAPEGAPAWRGFAIFRRECIACHAMNGEGGTVGPELNVPRSIVEYRPVEQIKAYVRDPSSFRYTTMPAHPHLSEEELEALVAYFRAMSAEKRDPGPPPAARQGP